MRLIIIDDVSVRDIADILGTRTSTMSKTDQVIFKTEENKERQEYLNTLVGKKVQIDDPNTGYHIGVIDDRAGESVHLEDIGWFSSEFITGIIA